MTKHWLRSGVIYCDGATIADCHVYPDCDHENWDSDCEEEHERTQHQECWKLEWVNSSWLGDTFDENYPVDYDSETATVAYPDGEVHVDWEGGWCTWGYVEVAK